MADMISNAQSINEAVALVHGVDAACGPAAAYQTAGAIRGFELSDQGLQALVARGIDADRLTTGGQDSQNVLWDLSNYNLSGDIWSASTVSDMDEWLTSALQQDKPVIMGLSEAHFLSDEPSTIHGHFVTVVGKNTDGSYVTADPNTVAASHGEFTANTAQQFFEAQGLGNITPHQSAGGSFLGPDIPLSFVDGMNSTSDSVSLPLDVNLGINYTDWKSPLTRLLFGLFGGIVILISFNNLLGALGLPDAQTIIKKEIGHGKEIATKAAEAAVIA
jgi:hypothetical protein